MFFGIFHIKPFDRPIFLNYPENLQVCGKDGETDTGRVLPSDYLWFSGDGKHNYFRNAYKGGETWDWSLPSPYET